MTDKGQATSIFVPDGAGGQREYVAQLFAITAKDSAGRVKTAERLQEGSAHDADVKALVVFYVPREVVMAG
jgi:hypothetical protein